MKTIGLLLLAIALVWAEDDRPNCSCGMYIQKDDIIRRVYRLDPFQVDNCDAWDVCKTSCANEFSNSTGGGDLNYELSNGYSVGQEICIALVQHHGEHNVHNAIVYGYANLCNGPWVYDGVSTINSLCCQDGFFTPC
ncbi:uncharacterized protein [Panulirus ornatus]|uniref:uncharacterized protein n=1 Tax=Panulirus ornatus TaxID=150431 RepID=UPI003A8C33B7